VSGANMLPRIAFGGRSLFCGIILILFLTHSNPWLPARSQ
jgi:hypothetical protein